MQVQIRVNGPDDTEVALVEPDAFTAFDALVQIPEHLWVRPDVLIALAGSRAEDPEWRRQYDAMVAFATSKGWTDEQGRIRAHVKQDRA